MAFLVLTKLASKYPRIENSSLSLFYVKNIILPKGKTLNIFSLIFSYPQKTISQIAVTKIWLWLYCRNIKFKRRA